MKRLIYPALVTAFISITLLGLSAVSGQVANETLFETNRNRTSSLPSADWVIITLDRWDENGLSGETVYVNVKDGRTSLPLVNGLIVCHDPLRFVLPVNQCHDEIDRDSHDSWPGPVIDIWEIDNYTDTNNGNDNYNNDESTTEEYCSDESSTDPKVIDYCSDIWEERRYDREHPRVNEESEQEVRPAPTGGSESENETNNTYEFFGSDGLFE